MIYCLFLLYWLISKIFENIWNRFKKNYLFKNKNAKSVEPIYHEALHSLGPLEQFDVLWTRPVASGFVETESVQPSIFQDFGSTNLEGLPNPWHSRWSQNTKWLTMNHLLNPGFWAKWFQVRWTEPGPSQ